MNTLTLEEQKELWHQLAEIVIKGSQREIDEWLKTQERMGEDECR